MIKFRFMDSGIKMCFDDEQSAILWAEHYGKKISITIPGKYNQIPTEEEWESIAESIFKTLNV